MNLPEAAALYHGLAAQREVAMIEIKRVVAEAIDDGYSERELATLFGVSRMTIRAWLGK